MEGERTYQNWYSLRESATTASIGIGSCKLPGFLWRDHPAQQFQQLTIPLSSNLSAKSTSTLLSLLAEWLRHRFRVIPGVLLSAIALFRRELDSV